MKGYNAKNNLRKENSMTPSTSIACYRCGGLNYKAPNCKFINATCHNCSKVGHLVQLCKKSRRSIKAIAHSVNDQENQLNDSEPEVAHFLNVGNARNPRDKLLSPIYIAGKKTSFELDTGATYSLMSQRNFQKLAIATQFQPCNLILLTHDKSKIPISYFVKVAVKYKEQEFIGNLYIVDDNFEQC